jgi:hypothetical protein
VKPNPQNKFRSICHSILALVRIQNPRCPPGSHLGLGTGFQKKPSPSEAQSTKKFQLSSCDLKMAASASELGTDQWLRSHDYCDEYEHTTTHHSTPACRQKFAQRQHENVLPMQNAPTQIHDVLPALQFLLNILCNKSLSMGPCLFNTQYIDLFVAFMEPCAILYYPNGQDNKIETPTDLLKFG